MDLPASAPVSVRDELDVATLLAYLRRESRDRLVVLLTTAPGEHAPHIAPEQVQKNGRGRADVVVMGGDRLTRHFSRQLASEDAGVFRGACRIYPPGTSWETQPRSTPLCMARDAEEIAALPTRLLECLRRELDRLDAVPPAVPSARLTDGPSPRQGAVPGVPKPGQGPSVPLPGAPVPGPRTFAASLPAGGVPDEIATVEDAIALGSHLRSPHRDMPVVVVSRSAGVPYAYADVAALRTDLAGLADVFEITTPTASWAFTDTVPDKCQVYGGAGRVYPVGVAWERDLFLSTLRFAHGMGDRNDVTRKLIADAMRDVAATGSLVVAPGQVAPVEADGVVEGIVAGQAMVRVDGGFAVAWPDLVAPGEAAERVFAKGMPLRGRVDPESRRLDITTPRQTPAEALQAYSADHTVLVRVVEVDAEACTVELFPVVRGRIGADDVAGAAVDLRELVTVGEVVPALVVERDAVADEWLLSIREAADAEEAVPAPSILVGGPPWLVPTVAVPAQVEPEHDVDDEGEAAGQSPVENAIRRENRQLVGRIRHLENRTAELEAQRDAARKQLRDALRRRSRDGSAQVDDGALFENEAEQLNFEIQLAWARMTLPGEKKDLPLKPWRYSEHFFATLEALSGVSRAKVVEVIVHVLTGRDADLASRELHALRTGKGGDDPPVVRHDGARCMRVNLQTNTASARRLHYWGCVDGSIELSSVRLHDDFRP